MSYPVQERRGEGWLLFASVVLITAGVMHVLDAFWAFDKDDELGENLQVVVWDDNLAAYGWLWLIIGVLLILAGFGVWRGSVGSASAWPPSPPSPRSCGSTRSRSGPWSAA